MGNVSGTNFGATGPKFQLSRAGLCVAAAVASGAMVAIVLGWQVKNLMEQNQQLRESAAAMEQQVLQAKAKQPSEQKLAELTRALELRKEKAVLLLELNAEVQRLALAMPELKTPQYKEPYQALLLKIQELNGNIQSLQEEATE
ncbi:hypothetical protein os4_36970 (plasmid) [Comamonadaceae bacterium OS-4]|nr:hypothetical protein os4_36970 [Comamonadaceae bacterium OS-4]